MYLLVQTGVIIASLAYAPAVPPITISSVAAAHNVNGFETALLYILYIAIFGIAGWFVIRNWKHKELLARIMDAYFIIVGSLVLFSIFVSFVYAFGVALILYVLKHISLDFRNPAAILASIGVGFAFGANFTPLTMIIILVLLAVYDFIAVYWIKNMVGMANLFSDIDSSMLIKAQRLVKKDVTSRVQLGCGDLIFPAGLVSSIVVGYGIGAIPVALGVIFGSAIGLYLLMNQLSKDLQPKPAIPAIAIGAILGAIVVGLIL